ncbi:MAG: zf-HC2 domain-containing protein [Chloroflexi bacterium]|nr:zf-HC2 domain-containing protein [Chloroflexota bacterium]
MQCADVIRYLSDYIDQNLSEALMEEARAHLATCRNCHVVLDSTQQTILLYRQQGQRIGMKRAKQDKLYAQLALALAGRADDCEAPTEE